KLNQLVNELRSRGVYRVAAFYSAGAWALLQVADVIFPIIGLPDWSVTAVLITAAAGFPIAIIVSWFFDMTPEGLVEAPVTPDEPTRPMVSASHLIQLVLIVVLTFLVGYLYLERLSDTSRDQVNPLAAPGTGRLSIAVMPFVNMSQVEDRDYIGDGLAEEILNLLAKLNELNVAARTSSFYFKDKTADIRAIAEQLGVSHVLEGSVRFDGEQVRVTAQLIEADNGYHLWSETYDRQMGSILALQDEIAAKVVTNLQLLLSPESREVLSQSTDVNPASVDYYLRGMAYLRMPPDTSSLLIARDFFEKATNTDPEFADAHAGLCNSLLGLYSIDLDIGKFHAAETACQRALVLDRRAGAVYTALGNLYTVSGQYDQAINEFNTAISLASASADAYLGLGLAYKNSNRPALAEQSFMKAIELQPNYWRAYMSMGNYLFDAGQVDQALPYYQRITELMPQSEIALNNLGAAHFISGNFAEAAQHWQQSLELAPSSDAYSNVATSLYLEGQYRQAAELYHKAVEFAPDDCELWGNLGDTYSQLPDGADLASAMYQNAIQLAEKRLQINASDSRTLALMGHYQAKTGGREQALSYIDRALDLAPNDMSVTYYSATALAELGELERSFDMLERALSLGYPWEVASADGNLKTLRSLPRYNNLRVLSE
ncbi:MAG: tetratricopeptide repeat protein, partial [Halieaceae bacterium]|nr:tetratricopeptide repeat protein [Halieaceae bacterium]